MSPILFAFVLDKDEFFFSFAIKANSKIKSVFLISIVKKIPLFEVIVNRFKAQYWFVYEYFYLTAVQIE